MNIIFFGTSEFAIPILETIKKAGYAPALIVSTPDKPKGRNLKLSPSPVKEWATKENLPVAAPERLKDESFLNKLRNNNPDIFIVASYGKIIPKEILDIPPKGTLNIHPSLLPKLRGPSPIQYTIIKNETPGVTIMLTDEAVDHGPILKSEKLKTKNEKLTYKDLELKLAKLGGKMLIDILPKWMNEEIRPKEQNHLQATFTKKITKEDGHINWQEDAEIIERKIRAFTQWPGTYTFWKTSPTNADITQTDAEKKQQKQLRLIITEAVAAKNLNTRHTYQPGTVFQTKNGDLAVAAQNGSLIVIRIKPEGKNEISGKEFLKGYNNIINNVLF